jgi:AcrR family transcriptional regulator
MQQRAIETRENILKTAIGIFSERGYHGTKVDQLAKAAAINKQRIYAYFHSKSGLFDQCLTTVFEGVKLFDAKAMTAARLEPSRLTEIILREYMALHKKHPYFWRMLAWTNLEDDSSLKKLPGLKEKDYTALKELFDKAVELGLLPRSVSFETYIFTLMAVSYFYHSNRKTLSKTLSPELFTSQGMEKLIAECSLMIAVQ